MRIAALLLTCGGCLLGLTPLVAGEPAAEQVTLFDGSGTEQLTSVDGKPCPWNVQDGALLVGKEDIQTRPTFKNAHIHIEFNLPEDNAGHGNSGLYIHHTYEVQILHSTAENKYAKPTQQCGALYQNFPPLANVCKQPGEWQTFDILFHGAKLDEAGKARVPARFTVFQNGVLVQCNRSLEKGTGAGEKRKMVEEGPIRLQSHSAPVRLRNFWFRPLPDIDEQAGPPINQTNRDQFAPFVKLNEQGVPADAEQLFDPANAKNWEGSPPVVREPAASPSNLELTNPGRKMTYGKAYQHAQIHLEWQTSQPGQSSGAKLLVNGKLLSLDPTTLPDTADDWQSLDVVWYGSRREGDQTIPATLTVLRNGHVVKDHQIEPLGALNSEAGEEPKIQLVLEPTTATQYRHAWVRPLQIPVSPQPKPAEPKKSEANPTDSRPKQP